MMRQNRQPRINTADVFKDFTELQIHMRLQERTETLCTLCPASPNDHIRITRSITTRMWMLIRSTHLVQTSCTSRTYLRLPQGVC